MSETVDVAVEEKPALAPRSAYVHLPFCKRRCYYCDFPIQVLGSKETDSTAQTVSHYVQLLSQEIEQTPVLGEHDLQTVFFGGGTPSLIPPTELARVIDALRQRFGLADGVEMSMEADPGTFDAQKLDAYVRLGVNRVSLGVQSFDEEILNTCGRSHSAADVWSAIKDIQSVEVPSWSLDLISGLPYTTLDSWRVTLDKAVDCQPDHISVYDLQIEKGTPFSRWYQVDTKPLPSHEASAEMYRLASQKLRDADYEHYEISNYAKEGHRCLHNLTYWNHQPFYGFGLGATSFTNNRRVARPRKMKSYVKWVQTSQQASLLDGMDSVQDNMLDTVMLCLRLRAGINLKHFAATYGSTTEEILKRSLVEYCERGLVEIVDRHGICKPWMGSWSNVASVRLSDPDGFLVSNDVLSTVFGAF